MKNVKGRRTVMQETDHDSLCAAMVDLLMQLGYYNEEFVFFGFAYLESRTRKYYVTADGNKAYSYNKKCIENGCSVTPVEKYFKWCKIEPGQRNKIKQQSKIEFASRLQTQYSKDFLEILEEVFNENANNTALPIIEQLKHELNGSFDDDGLNLFKGIVDMAYDAKRIRLMEYMKYKSWIDLQLTLNLPEKQAGSQKKVFTGFMYLNENHEKKYYFNAVPFLTQERKSELKRKGQFTFPIFQKDYYCKDLNAIYTAQHAFEECLKNRCNDNYIGIVKAIMQKDTTVDKDYFAKKLQEMPNMTAAEKEVMNYYWSELSGEMLFRIV